MKISEAAGWFEKRDNFLILTHMRPDGDTLGSAAALAEGLSKMGKTAYLLNNQEAIVRYTQYMGDYFGPEDFFPSFVVSIDTASEGMFPENAEAYKGKVDLSIDHHPSNSMYARETLLVSEVAACGEIIYEILKTMPAGITPKIAKQLYIAISTDTGCFKYANTTANTLKVASELVAAGAPSAQLNKVLFSTKSKGRIVLEGMILANIEFYRNDTVAIVYVMRKMLEETNTDELDLEDISAIPGQIEGVSVGVTIRELSDGKSKISVRTSQQINANNICEKLGGGGHAMAAGCTIDAPVSEAATLIKRTIDETWNEAK